MGSGSPGKKVLCRPQKIPPKLGLAHHPQGTGGTAETRGCCSPSCICTSLPRLVTALDKNPKSSLAYEAWCSLGLPASSRTNSWALLPFPYRGHGGLLLLLE